MTEHQKQFFKTIAFTTAGIGLAYVLNKYSSNISRKIKLLFDIRNPLRSLNIKVINTEDECRAVVELLKRQCSEYNVLGFDCEWVTVGGTRRPVALLQLASHDGLCALFRLCHLKKVPSELKALLEDQNILKVGVAPIDDARFLANDYSVQVTSTSDLRYLANTLGCKPQGLANMAYDFLGVTLDKNWRLRCSDWEADKLSTQQQEYAARDALVAIEIFKKLASKITNGYFWNSKSNYEEALHICMDFADMKYKQKTGKSAGQDQNATGEPHKLLKSGQISKPYYRNFSTRKKPLYHNCYLQAPDGEVLCTCDKRKAEWYVHKLLGNVVNEEPFTVRLKFEPSGRAVGEVGQYYIQAKINQCVVCGKKDSYIRKNVVPREYRKLFPAVMKEHTSHDVLLLCTPCHQQSNMSDLRMRRHLGIMCGAPIESDDGSRRFLESADLKQLKSAARALLQNGDNIPEARKETLRNIISKWYPDEEVTEDLIRQASDVQTAFPNHSYEPHGIKVVEYFSKHPELGGLVGLERMWREHFLKIMKPKYLPPLWSVNHNANRLEIRADEGRVDQEDLLVAGVNRQIAAEC